MPLLISITVQSISAMKLFKDFKLVFTQKQMAHKFNINRKYQSKTLSEQTKKFNFWFLGVYYIFNSFSIPFFAI